MGRLVNGVLDFAERMANRHIPMTMEDWAKRIDIILEASGDAVLQDAGKYRQSLPRISQNQNLKNIVWYKINCLVLTLTNSTPCLLTILTKYKNVVTLNHEWNNIQRIVQLQTSLNFVEFGIYHTLAPLLNPNWVHSRVLIELCQATIKVVS